MHNPADNLDVAAEYTQERTDAAVAEQVAAFRQASSRPSRPDCLECGEDIPEQRQLAVKGVQHCVACAQLIAIRKGGVRRG